ncbi:RsmD family RNA methyltransferase [Patescibacteria group bacterium]|nr:RsmD family RNA methyltransferase [Patescibacteria group bacterium]
MKIISGQYKNRTILAPPNIRPSTAKHKKIVFDTIRFNIPNSTVLDLYSGSGQVGLEALSLDAKHVTFVDQDPSCIDVINQNIQNLSIPADKFTIKQNSIKDFIQQTTSQYDIILADPPYSTVEWSDLTDINKLSHSNTIFVLKYAPHHPPPEFSKFALQKQKDQKDTIINFYLSSL